MKKKDFIIKNENVNLALLRFFWLKVRSFKHMVSTGAELEKLSGFLNKEEGEDFGVAEILKGLIEMGFLKQKGNLVTISEKGGLIGWY